MRLLEQVLRSLHAAALTPDGMAAPVAILWTDADGQWLPLMPALSAVHKWVYVLDKYAPANHKGPAIWLRCIVDRTLPEAPPAGEIPILYLPHVRRQELRAAGDCPVALVPLIELQYRGRVWHQPNGHDWTVRAFLASDDGLGLEIAGDRRTEEAMLRALPLLSEVDTNALRGRRLDADDFDKLAVADPVRDLLLWMNQPETFEAAAKGARWESFRAVCQSEFGMEVDKVSPAEVAGGLLQGDLRLDRVWNRFVESPQLYVGVAKLLREPVGAKQGKLTLDAARDPRINESEEAALRKDLDALSKLPHSQACAQLLQLEAKHAERRDWVWSRLGWSGWALALAPLARLARAVQKTVGGTTVDAVAVEYSSEGWQCDGAAMEALAQFRNGADAASMARVVKTLYEPWLDASARHLQSLVVANPSAARNAVQPINAQADTCVLFVDGLRFDVAGKLNALLEERTYKVSLAHRFAPIPTATPSAKPAAAPISGGIRGDDGADFTPEIETKSGWKPLTAPLLRDRLETEGHEVLAADETIIPGGKVKGGWTECGQIDSMGHSLQLELVHQISTEVERIAARAESLLESGWRQVRIVTDHGWLLLPGGLPKIALPTYVAETKWARCALVKGTPDVSVPVIPWHWNSHVQIASPPGIGCFRAGDSYAHGGISPQECIVPELIVERGADAVHVSILSIEWRGMRCKVRVDTNVAGTKVDLRTNWKLEATSIAASPKGIGINGEASLAVSDDRHEGASAALVILDAGGKVIANQLTTVGEK